MSSHRIGVIGGGNMGGAIVRGGIRASVFQPAEVIVLEIDHTRRDMFAEIGCAVTVDPKVAADADQIILAVKPQVFPDVARALQPLSADKIVLSIMAGLNTGFIRQSLGEKARMVRAMPNIPCQIGAGMTAIALGEGSRPGDEATAVSIFTALGRTAMVDESLLHAVTAVSGSGPAYVFLLAQAMEEAAVNLGIDAETARLMVEQTVMGAGKLLSESQQSAEQLRQSVTSPGGTTAAAFDVFERRNFTEIVIEALTAAHDRSRALDTR